jgi:hypothetical protein
LARTERIFGSLSAIARTLFADSRRPAGGMSEADTGIGAVEVVSGAVEVVSGADAREPDEANGVEESGEPCKPPAVVALACGAASASTTSRPVIARIHIGRE